jgi:hypothetical protein
MIESVRIIDFTARFVARLSDGRRVFVKAGGRRSRERYCLGRLKGLAVPKRVPLARSELDGFLGGMAASAQTCVRGRELDRAGLTPEELIGVWAFAAEQLAAFRRCGILYTDVKCANILAAKRPLAALIVDFDLAVPLSERGVYRTDRVGYTQGFEAPEQPESESVTERSLVYQLAMLLPHCLLGTDNTSLGHPLRGLPALRRILAEMGAEGLARAVEDGLSWRTADRPRDYDAFWRLVRGGDAKVLPRAAEAAWTRLRRPYERRLSALGFSAEKSDPLPGS